MKQVLCLHCCFLETEKIRRTSLKKGDFLELKQYLSQVSALLYYNYSTSFSLRVGETLLFSATVLSPPRPPSFPLQLCEPAPTTTTSNGMRGNHSSFSTSQLAN